MKRLNYRRKREGRTDYKKRMDLLKSGKPRLIARKSLKNMIVQIVSYKEKGDKVVTSASTKELEKQHGWKHGRGNIPAAYLAGLLCGKKAKAAKIDEAVFDIGLQKSIRGCRLYAALKGVIDAGVAVPHSESVMPPEERLNGEHIPKDKEQITQSFKRIKSDIIGK